MSEEEKEETVTITKEEYIQLLNDSNFLNALRAGGVDNWEGYDFVKFKEITDLEEDNDE